MNYTYISGLTIATLILSIYFIKSYKKFSRYQMPFLKAFNPMYAIDRYHADELKKSMMPIVSELETRDIANFINFWKKKFENDALTIEDVKFLNEQLVAGNTNQVNGILALHPKAIEIYNTLNETLNPVEKEAFQEELVEV